MRNQGRPVIDSPAKFAWKLGSCRNYRPAINQRIMSQTRTRVVQTCQSFLDSFAGIFQSFARMGKTIFHAVLYNNKAYNTTCYTISLPYQYHPIARKTLAHRMIKNIFEMISNNSKKIQVPVIFCTYKTPGKCSQRNPSTRIGITLDMNTSILSLSRDKKMCLYLQYWRGFAV